MRRTLAFASLLAAAVACDDGNPSIVDARDIDAQANDCGCVSDTPVDPVTVTVFDAAAPVAAVPVYFLDRAGALVTVQDTDASGVARAELPTGGSVTAVIPTGGFAPRLATALGVQSGDFVGIRAPGGGTSKTIDLTFPAHGSDGHFVIRSGCGNSDLFVEAGSTVTAQLMLWECGDRTDFVVSADNGDGGPVATFVAADVAVADGAAVTITGSYVDDVDVTTTYTNLAGNQGVIQIDRAIVTSPFVVGSTWSSVDVVGGTGTATLSVPVFTAPSRGSVVASGRVWGIASMSEVHELAGGDYTLDTTGVFLRSFTQNADFDVATRTLTWAETAAGAVADATVARIQIDRPSQKASWDWYVVAPHDAVATEVQLPQLPGDAAMWNPVDTDGSFVIEHYTVKTPAGYRALVTAGLTDLAPEALTFAGRVVVERQQILTAGRRAR